jgi:hypothetical protein
MTFYRHLEINLFSNESVPVLGRETTDGLFICVGRDTIADKKIPENTMCVYSRGLLLIM